LRSNALPEKKAGRKNQRIQNAMHQTVNNKDIKLQKFVLILHYELETRKTNHKNMIICSLNLIVSHITRISDLLLIEITAALSHQI